MIEFLKQNKKTCIILLCSFLVLCFAVLGTFLYFYFSKYISSEEVKILTEPSDIVSKVTGEIIELNAQSNIEIKEGEIIAQINPESYEEKLKTIEEKYDKIKIESDDKNRDYEKLSALALENKDTIDKAKTELESANSDYVRYKNAYKDGSVTKQDLNNAIANLEVAKVNYKKAQEELENSNQLLKLSTSKKNSKDDELKKILQQLEEARLNLSYTTITAPFTGIIINNDTKIGDVAEKGTRVVSIIPKEFFITAHFDSEQKDKLKKGQRVKIFVSINKKIRGIVVDVDDSLATIQINGALSKYLKDAKATVKIKVK